mgnify:FL=1
MHFGDRKKLRSKIVCSFLLFVISLAAGVLAAVIVEHCVQATEPVDNEVQTGDAGMDDEAVAAFGGRQSDELTKKVALTFDDGPNPDYTPELLDELKKRGVPATFFVLGAEVEQYPQLVRRASEEGHLIGVHSYKHVNLRQLSDQQAVEQVNRTNEAIHAACGQYASYIRPPYGCWKEDLDYEVQMVEVLWDIDPRDWATTSADLVVQRVLQDVEENSIILLHDASESSVRAACMIIDRLQAQGYTFVTVEELLME